MGAPIRIHVRRFHMPAFVLGVRGAHEWEVWVSRGEEELSVPRAFGRDLGECIRRAVDRVRKARGARVEATRG